MIQRASSSTPILPVHVFSLERDNLHPENRKTTMRQRIIHYLRAGYAGLYLVSPQEQRVEAEFKAIAEELSFSLHVWSATSGLLDITPRSIRDCNDPMAVLLAIAALPTKPLSSCAISTPSLLEIPIRSCASTQGGLAAGKMRNKALVLVAAVVFAARTGTGIDRDRVCPPGKDDLARVLDGVLESAQQDGITLPTLEPEQQETLLGAASG